MLVCFIDFLRAKWCCLYNSTNYYIKSEIFLEYIFLSALSILQVLVTSFTLLLSCRDAHRFIMKNVSETELRKRFATLH